jgi:excisionase family DNA binding protein
VKQPKVATTVSVEPWVGTDQVAEWLGKPSSWLYNNAERLGIPRVRIGNQYRYKLSQVDAWLGAGEGTAA